MKFFIPNVLNDVLDFFFADQIVLFLSKYHHIESSRSYSNLLTQHFDANTSVYLGRVDFGSLISYSGKDARFHAVAQNFFQPSAGSQ
jgi:hypothetical protein